MAGMNKAIIVGNLGRDPEARSMNNGSEVVSFSVATSETWNDKQSGDRKEKTEWHNVVIFNEGLGKIAKQYLRKGSTVYLEGAIQTRKYTDRDGNEKTMTEIVLQRFRGELVLLGGKGEGSRDDGDKWRDDSRSSGQSRGGGNGGASPFDADLDDSVPFASADPRHELRKRVVL